MGRKTKPFDPAQYLENSDDQAELLADAVASGNAGYIANALGIIARARGMTSVANEAGITREALYRSLSEVGDPQLTTVLGVAKALGLEVSFVPKDKTEKQSLRKVARSQTTGSWTTSQKASSAAAKVVAGKVVSKSSSTSKSSTKAESISSRTSGSDKGRAASTASSIRSHKHPKRA